MSLAANLAADFTLRDLAGAGLGCLLFIPILLAPGYVAAWFTGVLGFRGLTPPWRVLLSLPLSAAICPIATYWAGSPYFGHEGSWLPVFAMYGCCFLIWLALLAGLGGHEPLFKRRLEWLRGFRAVPRIGWAIAAAWLAVALFSLVNLQIGDRLYLSFTDYDHVTRAAITDAIVRDGVRPLNPFYYLGATAPLRYHYFWFLLCGLAVKMSGGAINSPQAMMASAVWCGWSLMALPPLYARFFLGRSGLGLRRCGLAGVGLLAVTGLDIIPVALYAAAGRWNYPEMEWWNDQVTSWIGSLIWVPHHVAGLVICLTGFLLLWDAGGNVSMRRRVAGAALGGAALASAAGASIYVFFVFGVFLIVWTVLTWLPRWRRPVAVPLLAGLAAIVLVAPYLLSLIGSGGGGSGVTGAAVAGAANSFVKFDVRQFYPLVLVTHGLAPGSATMKLLRLLALPLNYFVELGFFGVAGVVFLRGRPKSAELTAAMTMAGVSIAMCTFLRSGVIAANDLGWRGFLPAQFILLLWGADLMVERGERAEAQGKSFRSWWLRSPVWAPLLLLGLAGTAYELVQMRTYFLFTDAGVAVRTGFAPDRHFGERAFELRQVYETLDRTLPPLARIQANPEGRYFDFYRGLYSNRSTVVADSGCGTAFGGDATNCAAAYRSMLSIYRAIPGLTWKDVEAICRRMSIDALIVTDLDPAWVSEAGWGWQARPAIVKDHVRVYLMGDPGL